MLRTLLDSYLIFWCNCMRSSLNILISFFIFFFVLFYLFCVKGCVLQLWLLERWFCINKMFVGKTRHCAWNSCTLDVHKFFCAWKFPLRAYLLNPMLNQMKHSLKHFCNIVRIKMFSCKIYNCFHELRQELPNFLWMLNICHMMIVIFLPLK